MENLTLDTLLGHARNQLKRWQRAHNDIQDYQKAYTRNGMRFVDIFDYQAYMTIKKFEVSIRNSPIDWLSEVYGQNKCVYEIRPKVPAFEAVRNMSFIYTPVGKVLHACLYYELAAMRHVHLIKNPQPLKRLIKVDRTHSFAILNNAGVSRRDFDEKIDAFPAQQGVVFKNILVWMPSITAPTYSLVFISESLQQKLSWPLKIGYVQINPHHVNFQQFSFELLYGAEKDGPVLTFGSFNSEHDIRIKRLVQPVKKLEDIYLPEIKKLFKIKASSKDTVLATERGQVDNHKEQYNLLHNGGMLIESTAWNNYELLNDGDGNAATWLSNSEPNTLEYLAAGRNYGVKENDRRLYEINIAEQTATPESTLGMGVAQIKPQLMSWLANTCLEPQVLNL